MTRFILNHSSMVPIYEQLMNQIKSAVMEGDLKPGEPLPSVRALSSQLKISALTVKKTYDRLEEEGFAVTVHGKGTYIADTDPVHTQEERRMQAEKILSEAIERVKSLGLESDDITEIFNLLMEEE